MSGENQGQSPNQEQTGQAIEKSIYLGRRDEPFQAMLFPEQDIHLRA